MRCDSRAVARRFLLAIAMGLIVNPTLSFAQAASGTVYMNPRGWARLLYSESLSPNVCATTVGGELVVIGFSTAYPNELYGHALGLVVRLDGHGNIQRTQCFGSIATPLSSLEGGCTTPDGGYVAVGHTVTSGIDFAGVILKFGAYGDLQWLCMPEPSGHRPGTLYGVCVDSEGHLFVGGTVYMSPHNQLWLMRLTPNGEIEWSRIGSTNYTGPTKLLPGPDGVVYGIGQLTFFRAHRDGVIDRWSAPVHAMDFTIQPSGQITVVGYVNVGSGAAMSLAPDLSFQWWKEYPPPPGSSGGYFESVAHLEDGAILVGGTGEGGAYVLRLASNDGAIDWQHRIDLPSYDEASGVRVSLAPSWSGPGAYVTVPLRKETGPRCAAVVMRLPASGTISADCALLGDLDLRTTDLISSGSALKPISEQYDSALPTLRQGSVLEYGAALGESLLCWSPPIRRVDPEFIDTPFHVCFVPPSGGSHSDLGAGLHGQIFPIIRCNSDPGCLDCIQFLGDPRKSVANPAWRAAIYQAVVPLVDAPWKTDADRVRRLAASLRAAPVGRFFTEDVRRMTLGEFDSLRFEGSKAKTSVTVPDGWRGLDATKKALSLLELDLTAPQPTAKNVSAGRATSFDGLVFVRGRAAGKWAIRVTPVGTMPDPPAGYCPGWPVVGLELGTRTDARAGVEFEVGINYKSMRFVGEGPKLRLLHRKGDQWEDATTRVDAKDGVIWGVGEARGVYVVMSPRP